MIITVIVEMMDFKEGGPLEDGSEKVVPDTHAKNLPSLIINPIINLLDSAL